MKAVCDRHQEAYEVCEGCKWCEEHMRVSFSGPASMDWEPEPDYSHEFAYEDYCAQAWTDANGSPVSTIAAKHETVLYWIASGFLSPEFGADMLGLPGSEAVIKRLQECADRVRKAQEVAQPECAWHAIQDALADDFAARACRYAHGQMSPDEAEKLEQDARSVLDAAYPGQWSESVWHAL